MADKKGMSLKDVGPIDRFRAMPVAVGLTICLIVLAFIPPIMNAIIAFDHKSAHFMNGLLGHIRMVDFIVAGINTQAGDKVIFICMALLFGSHIFRPTSVQGRMERVAFWFWAGLMFLLVYQCQEIMEEAFSRDSPGKELTPWFDLREAYELPTRVSNSHSYPSGHATAYFFFAFVALRRYRKIGACLLAISLTVPASRVMTGGHWFTDIFLGSLPLAAIGATLVMETRLWKLKGIIEKVLLGLWQVITTLESRSLRTRSKSAWREFLASESLLVANDEKCEPKETE